MKLGEIGEFGFIDRITDMFGDLQHEGCMGIGDDCAIIPCNEQEDYLVTTDLLIEDVHFLKHNISPEQLGYKSLAVNLSDIAAMGGLPVASFLSVSVTTDTSVEYLDAFLKGYHKLSAKYGVPLLGGDTTKSKSSMSISVTVIGKCAKGKAKLRSAAENDDIICLTGFVGDSAGGLSVLLNKLPLSKDNEQLVLCHNMPEPHINEGLWLFGYEDIHAMMDVSDGIASDLIHILKASAKSAEIDTEKLPVSGTLKKLAVKNKWNIDKLVVSGGEDYVLLLTVKNESFKKISELFRSKFKKDLYPVGTIMEGSADIKWLKAGKEINIKDHGFDHFIE